MSNTSLGFIEITGVVAAVDALDIMCKTSGVELATWERKLGGRLVTIVVKGDGIRHGSRGDSGQQGNQEAGGQRRHRQPPRGDSAPGEPKRKQVHGQTAAARRP